MLRVFEFVLFYVKSQAYQKMYAGKGVKRQVLYWTLAIVIQESMIKIPNLHLVQTIGNVDTLWPWKSHPEN